MLHFLVLAFCIPTLFFCSCANAEKNIIRVAAASSLKVPLDSIAAAFEKTHHFKVEFSFAASGKLATQIIHSAPFDLFISADTVFPSRLFKEGHCWCRPKIFGETGLALVSRLPNWPDDWNPDSTEIFFRSNVKTIALANPKLAPFGVTAEKFLKYIGAENYKDIQPKLVYVENVAQVASLLETGAVDVGFISRGQALNLPRNNQWKYFFIDPPFAEMIPQSIAMVKTKGKKAVIGADDFYKFISSPEAWHIFQKFGYENQGRIPHIPCILPGDK